MQNKATILFQKELYKKNCIQKRDFLTGPQHKNIKCATNVVSLCAATSGFYDTNLNTLKYNTYIHYSPFVISSLIVYDRHKEVPALQTTWATKLPHSSVFTLSSATLLSSSCHLRKHLFWMQALVNLIKKE